VQSQTQAQRQAESLSRGLPGRPALEAAAGAGALRYGPLDLLTEHWDALDLTPAQQLRLERIRKRLARENDPLIARMVALRSEWQAERLAAQRAGGARETPRLVRIRAAAEPLHAEIQRNTRTAMQAVHQMLLPRQRMLLRELMQEVRRPDDQPAGARVYDGRGGR
jgi:hypothetical protein